jgi:anti-sigma regulatory factor (Ser/Thr protein kinase)
MPEILRLPTEPIAPALARASVTGVARPLSDVALADLNLLVTEVVSNAVRHGRLTGSSEVVVAVDVADDRVTVSVSDTGPGFGSSAGEYSDLAADSRDGGWGVFLLKRLASDWGVERDADRTTVWFAVDR